MQVCLIAEIVMALNVIEGDFPIASLFVFVAHHAVSLILESFLYV